LEDARALTKEDGIRAKQTILDAYKKA